jgi:uncharacterized membrane-anchored protein
MKLKALILVLALQTAWVLGTTFVQERSLANGTLILLETRPVDPRDLLRGDFVILNYAISTVPVNAFVPSRTNAPPPGQAVYVLLERRGEFHEVVRASTGKLTPGDGQVVLQGTCRYWWDAGPGTPARIEYGLERYFVREGTGNPSGKLTVQVAVPASGHGVIKEVLVNGKPYAEVMKDQR